MALSQASTQRTWGPGQGCRQRPHNDKSSYLQATSQAGKLLVRSFQISYIDKYAVITTLPGYVNWAFSDSLSFVQETGRVGLFPLPSFLPQLTETKGNGSHPWIPTELSPKCPPDQSPLSTIVLLSERRLPLTTLTPPDLAHASAFIHPFNTYWWEELYPSYIVLTAINAQAIAVDKIDKIPTLREGSF